MKSQKSGSSDDTLVSDESSEDNPFANPSPHSDSACSSQGGENGSDSEDSILTDTLVFSNETNRNSRLIVDKNLLFMKTI